MDANQFDDLTERLMTGLSRRRGLGLLGVLGAAGLGLAGEAKAGKKSRKRRRRRKKKQKCKGCTACQACVAGVCQPLADGATCDQDGICTNDVCGQPCTFNNDPCPDGTFCPLESTVCVTGFDCNAPCANDADCGTGEVCMATPNCGLFGDKRCGTIAPI
jgi:hypothetical protein